MPELPDVEMQKRYFDRTSLDRSIVRIDILEPRILKGGDPERMKGTLRGNRFRSTCRHGKYLFAGLDRGPWIVFHFGMDGYFVYAPEETTPEGNARVLIQFGNDHRLSYNSWRMLGRIGLAEGPADYLNELGIGPDALDPELDFTRFREILTGKKSPVKPVIMDQHNLAGIGNVYADEILFQARIHPITDVSTLEADRLKALYTSIRKVLRSAIGYSADVGRFPKRYLLPHRHPEGRCPICGTMLQTVKLSGRTGYYCPKDQKP